MAIDIFPACSSTEGKLVGMSAYDRAVRIVKAFNRMYVAPTKPCSHDPNLEDFGISEVLYQLKSW